MSQLLSFLTGRSKNLAKEAIREVLPVDTVNTVTMNEELSESLPVKPEYITKFALTSKINAIFQPRADEICHMCGSTAIEYKFDYAMIKLSSVICGYCHLRFRMLNPSDSQDQELWETFWALHEFQELLRHSTREEFRLTDSKCDTCGSHLAGVMSQEYNKPGLSWRELCPNACDVRASVEQAVKSHLSEREEHPNQNE